MRSAAPALPRLCARLCSALLLVIASAVAGRELPECPPFPTVTPPRGRVAYDESLLWEVRADGRAPSFVFGTIHLSGQRVAQPSPAVTSALMGSRQFGMEVVLDLDTLMRIAGHMRYADGQRLRDALDPALHARTLELLAAYGVEGREADSLKPWAAYMTLSLPPDSQGTPLDLVLLGAAQRSGKPVFGLETLEEQVAVFEALPAGEQSTLLLETVCHQEQVQQLTASIVAHYRRGDLAALYAAAQATETAAQRRLMASLLTARNARMAARLVGHLAEGGVFVAIGALHLPGPDGVLARLAASGLALRPLPSR